MLEIWYVYNLFCKNRVLKRKKIYIYNIYTYIYLFHISVCVYILSLNWTEKLFTSWLGKRRRGTWEGRKEASISFDLWLRAYLGKWKEMVHGVFQEIKWTYEIVLPTQCKHFWMCSPIGGPRLPSLTANMKELELLISGQKLKEEGRKWLWVRGSSHVWPPLNGWCNFNLNVKAWICF